MAQRANIETGFQYAPTTCLMETRVKKSWTWLRLLLLKTGYFKLSNRFIKSIRSTENSGFSRSHSQNRFFWGFIFENFLYLWLIKFLNEDCKEDDGV